MRSDQTNFIEATSLWTHALFTMQCHGQKLSANQTDVYARIDADHIRVVDLKLDAEHSFYAGMPACDIRTIPRPTSSVDSPYTAVSYACDASNYCWYGRCLRSPSDLMVNGHVVQLPSQIVLILSILAIRGIKTIWMDMLSINQADKVEKGSQVSQMGETFRNAREVVVFLGCPSKNTDAALLSMPPTDFVQPAAVETNRDSDQKVDDQVRHSVKKFEIIDEPSSTDSNPASGAGSGAGLDTSMEVSWDPDVDGDWDASWDEWERNPDVNSGRNLDARSVSHTVSAAEPDMVPAREPVDDPVAKGFHELGQHNIWLRAWIVQELALASQLGLICGTIQLRSTPRLDSKSVGSIFKLSSGKWPRRCHSND
jgi:hypothetical protein